MKHDEAGVRAMRCWFNAVCAGLVIIGSLPAVADSEIGILGKVQRVVSPGGIEAWLIEDHTVPLVAIEFAFYGGSYQDDPGKEGLSRLTASLVNKGAGDMPEVRFKERMEDLVMHLGFSSGRTWCYGGAKIVRQSIDESADMLSLALREPRFDEEVVERVRGVSIKDLEASQKSASFVADDLLRKAQYEGHPFARPPSGTMKTLAAITLEDIKKYHRRIFVKDKLKVAVVGSVNAEKLGPLLDKIFGSLPEGGDISPVEPIKPKTDFTLRQELDVPQANIIASLPWVGIKDDDFMAAYLINNVLGGPGLSSWLFDEVRIKRGLVYSIGSSSSHEPPVFFVKTMTANEKVPHAVLAIKEQLSLMAEKGPSQEELDLSKEDLKRRFLIDLDTLSQISSFLTTLQRYGFSIDYPQKRNSLIDSVTVEDVKRVARRLFSVTPGIVIVGKNVTEEAKN